MAIDILVGASIVLLAVLGWNRGLVSQGASIALAVGLWASRDHWMGPAGAILGALGPPLSDHPSLRRMLGFAALYTIGALIVLVIERKVVRRFGPLRWTNHWLGGLLGALKGVVYAVVILWAVQAATHWKAGPTPESVPWLEESQVVQLVSPYNPVRLFTLRELIDELVARAQSGRAEAPKDRRRKQLLDSEAVMKLLEDLKKEGEAIGSWDYNQLVTDPRIREIVDDPEVQGLLFGK